MGNDPQPVHFNRFMLWQKCLAPASQHCVSVEYTVITSVPAVLLSVYNYLAGECLCSTRRRSSPSWTLWPSRCPAWSSYTRRGRRAIRCQTQRGRYRLYPKLVILVEASSCCCLRLGIFFRGRVSNLQRPDYAVPQASNPPQRPVQYRLSLKLICNPQRPVHHVGTLGQYNPPQRPVQYRLSLRFLCNQTRAGRSRGKDSNHQTTTPPYFEYENLVYYSTRNESVK